MKKQLLLISFIISVSVFSGINAQAQLKGLWQKAKDKASQKAEEMLDKKSSAPSETTAQRAKPAINYNSDFIPGDSLIFTEDFAKIAAGASAPSFKTNGSGVIVTIDNEPGKWLSLQEKATYKLTKQLFYPKHFTLEFDILAIADKINDIYPVYFGFTKNNSVSQYESAEGASVALQYYNNDDVVVNSSNVGKYLDTKFDLTTFTNRKMHVSLVVNGEKMAVYLDKTKIADTQSFLPTDAKNFYISGPIQYQNGAKALVGNFRIARFKTGE